MAGMRPVWILVTLVACSRERALIEACDGREEPDACQVLSARYAYGDGLPKDPARAITYAARARELCARPGVDASKCSLVRGAVPLTVDPQAPVAVASAVLDIVVFADGKTTADGTVVDDDALRAIARVRVTANPDFRAVVRADKDALHGRVVQILDALKQAGVTKIAFAVGPTK
jgi:biopolymer transport protein ExbD